MLQIHQNNLCLDFNIHGDGINFSRQNRYKFCSYTTSAENQSADIKLSLPAGKKITIYWGDGTSTVVTGAVTTTTYSHIYTDIKTYNLTISGDYNDITYLKFEGDGSYGGDIKYLPNNLSIFAMLSENTYTGDVKNLPVGITYFYISGSNTIYGVLQDFPHGIISITIYGLNTLAGSLTASLNVLNTLKIAGLNTISGNLAVIADTIETIYLKGNNTISNYTGKTWVTNLNYFNFSPVSPGGLSSAETDQLLIDLDEDLDWSGGGSIVLTGTNAPRTSASDDAVNNIVAEGGTVITNN